jgi:hypothetical protein
MKVTTTVPTPVPITWHLDLTDDEMADLVLFTHAQHGCSQSGKRVHHALTAVVPPQSWNRLIGRGNERTT